MKPEQRLLAAQHLQMLARMGQAWNRRLSALNPPDPEWAEHPALAEVWAASRWLHATQGGPTLQRAAEAVVEKVREAQAQSGQAQSAKDVQALREDIQSMAAEWAAEWEKVGPSKEDQSWQELQDIAWLHVAREALDGDTQTLPPEMAELEAQELPKLDAGVVAREEDGLPWLSHRLWLHLKELAPEVAQSWKQAHGAPEQQQLPGVPARPYLWAWFPSKEKPVPYAYRALADAVWRAVTGPRLEAEQDKRVPMLPMARFSAAIGRDTRGMDGEVLELLKPQLPERAARQLANHGASYPLRIELIGHILGLLYQQLNSDGPTRHSRDVPKLVIPAGVELAKALGLAPNGKNKDSADNAVQRLAAEEWRDKKESFRWLMAERVQPAPGKASVWIITPGELLLPVYGKAGRLVPWPDVAPDMLWAGPVNKQKAAAAGHAMALIWRDAAGHKNGAEWLREPGVPLKVLEQRWSDFGGGLDLARFIGAQEEKGWAYVENGKFCPSPDRMPGLTRKLQEGAEQARDAKEGGRRKPRKNAQR